MTFEELYPGLLVRVMSKSESGPKYFLCVRINADVEVVTFMYVSTDRDDGKARYNHSIDSRRLPFEPSETGWSAFSFDNLPRYRKDEFEPRFLKEYGRLDDGVVTELRRFCEDNKNDIGEDDFKYCKALFDALVPPAPKPKERK